MKTLKEILQLEVYEPKSPDEKRFKDKHVVVKHKDANGNGDDLFNAKNIKTVDRKPEHGYNPGEDEKVYESYDLGHPVIRAYLDAADKHRNGKETPHASIFKKPNLSDEDIRRLSGNPNFNSAYNSRLRNDLDKLHRNYRERFMKEEVEELDERQMNVYAIATAQVKKKYGLKGKNVDLTKAQTVEAHTLAKKIAKKMGVSLKESLDEQSLRQIRDAFKKTFGKKSPGVAAKREELKAAAKAATSPKPTEQDTTARMKQKLGNILQGPKSPEYPKEMLGTEDEGPDKRYGTGPQDLTKALAKVPGRGIVIGSLDPNYKKPTRTRSKK